jgi:hypothetical protein
VEHYAHSNNSVIARHRVGASRRPMTGSSGRSSTPRRRGSIVASGILDRPVKPGDDKHVGSALGRDELLSIRISNSPPCADTASRSRGWTRPSFVLKIPPSSIRGRRECRAPDAPAAACAKVVVESTRVSQVTPESPGIPPAMVLTVSFVLSPATGLSCHRRPRKFSSANLTPASGRQDHTTSPSASAPFVRKRICVHRISPRVRDVAQRPSVGQDGASCRFDLPDAESEIFL